VTEKCNAPSFIGWGINHNNNSKPSVPSIHYSIEILLIIILHACVTGANIELVMIEKCTQLYSYYDCTSQDF
jgi:hypothetical protein